MKGERFLKNGSVRDLIGLALHNKHLRGRAMKTLESMIHDMIVGENAAHRPVRVQEEKYVYAMALLKSAERAIERRLISRRSVDRLMDVLLTNVILKDGKKGSPSAVSPDREPPLFVLVSPTGRCNLRCKGCYAASDPGKHASLDAETFDRILTEKEKLWGSHFTVISGGEPFLWRDGEVKLLDIVEKHPSDFFLSFTNATLITDEVARRMAELGNFTPAISVEGFEEETDARRGKGVHKRILRAFENLRNHGVPFGISATPTRHNWDIIASEEFVDLYFEREGATYAWLFQYMPIGRGRSLELMMTPEQRLEMADRIDRLVRERQVFIADFWNNGVLSDGCISAGRAGGYLYIDWNGDISPCAFVPYASGNIYDIYARGGTLDDALKAPFLREIRRWQGEYGFRQPRESVGNWLCPCVIRDHFAVLKSAVVRTGARPLNEEAAAAISDAEYERGMIRYGKKMEKLTDPMWRQEYLDKMRKQA